MVYHITLITTIVPHGATLYLNNLIFDHKLHLLLVYTFHLTPQFCALPKHNKCSSVLTFIYQFTILY